MRKTKIIATMGPAVENRELLLRIFEKADVARFNLSHGDYSEHRKRKRLVDEVAGELKKIIPTMADTQGPEMRTTNREPFEIRINGHYDLMKDIGVTYGGLPKDVKKGDMVVIADGDFRMRVLETGRNSLKVHALTGGMINPKRKVSVPGELIHLPTISAKDRKDIGFIARNDFDLMAQSFVRHAREVDELRKCAAGLGWKGHIIAKIEHPRAVEEFDGIIAAADGAMIARGDLGVEVSFDRLPGIQRALIRKARKNSKPVIVATHMMKSMVSSPFPTRAEVVDVANAVYQGTDAVMLSEETAIGHFPYEAVDAMDRIASTAELDAEVEKVEPVDNKDVMAQEAFVIADKFGCPMVAPTESGTTPRKISKYRPRLRIYAMTPHRHVAAYVTLCYGVVPVISRRHEQIYRNFAQIKGMLGINKAVFVFGYPMGNKRTNSVIYA
jgi:pyruvate kinase